MQAKKKQPQQKEEEKRKALTTAKNDVPKKRSNDREMSYEVIDDKAVQL